MGVMAEHGTLSSTEYKRRWRELNPEADRRAREADFGRLFERNRYGRHHTTLEAMVGLYVDQGARCGPVGSNACRERFGFEELDIDHDHDHCDVCAGQGWSCGESIRGLLCRSCNVKDVLAS